MEDEETKELTIETRCEENDVCLKVTDSGKGISKLNMVKIFNHGFSTKKDRTGLGLHICATSMSEMGGKVRVDSEGKGKGATFYLSWPAFEEEKEKPVG